MRSEVAAPVTRNTLFFWRVTSLAANDTPEFMPSMIASTFHVEDLHSLFCWSEIFDGELVRGTAPGPPMSV